jgi:hypothetical protein
MALTRASVENVIIAITIAEMPRVVRLVRGVVLTLREQPYVEAADRGRHAVSLIIIKHMLPNTMAPLIVQATFICASAMLTEADLSFLGAGTPPKSRAGATSWPRAARFWQIKPWTSCCSPASSWRDRAGVNLLGDGLRDRARPAHGAADVITPCPHPAPRHPATCRRISSPSTASCAPSTGCRSRSAPARRWASWANRAAARASPRCRSCG